MNKKLTLLALLGIIVTFSGTVLAESDITSLSFYRFNNTMITDEDKATIVLEEGLAAGLGDWYRAGWINVDCPWDPDGNDETPDVITSSSGSEALFYFHDTHNGGPYNGVRTTDLGDGNADMMDGHANGTEDSDEIVDMTVSDIPFDTYDVIFYIGSQEAQFGDGTGKFVFNGVELIPGDLEGLTRHYIRIDRVNYSDGSHPDGDDPDLWPTTPDGGGDSLTRKVPGDYGNDVANWQSGIPTPGQ